MLKAYPTMPTIDIGEINSVQDYAYALHDQAIFMRDTIESMRQLQDTHFMTRKNK